MIKLNIVHTKGVDIEFLIREGLKWELRSIF